MIRPLSLAPLLLAAAAAAAPFNPSPRLRFSASPEEIAASCRDSRRRAESALAQIAALPATARTFDNTPWALDRTLAELSDATASDSFLKYVSVSSAVRAAANDCETLLGQFDAETYAREDLYAALKAYAARGERLDAEDARLLERQLRDFRRAGLELTKEKRAEVLALRKELVALEAKFTRNINESRDAAYFEPSRLRGLPQDFIDRLEESGGRKRVTLDYPDYFPFMDNARDAAARRELEAKFNNRAYPENLPILAEVLEKRRRAARLLGYPTHAHFVLETRMAKDPATVRAFLARLVKRLKPLGREELETLVALKRAFEGRSSDGRINAWDWRFYDNQLRKAKYAVDSQKVREYFPADLVAEQMLAVYQKLLGLRFRLVEDAAAWHPDARLYEISDAAGGKTIAWFYMDLFPREGKYKHAAAFSLISGRELPGLGYQRPVSAMVANFDKPTPSRPSLLTHDEVETFFHEFGHIMHQTLTRARHARFSGTATARDFVEAPSQMLENWVWDAEVLKSLSGHYKDRSKKLPRELLDSMLAAKHADAGLIHLRQLLFGSVDFLYHTDAPGDTTSAYARLMREIALIPMSPGTHPEAGFGHLMGYDAGYYGYLWSKVYAEDMASEFRKEGFLNPLVGRRYRAEILEKGSSRDEMESIKAFLGREPNEDAFLESIGLGAAN